MKTLAILAQPDEAGGIFRCFPACRVIVSYSPTTPGIGRDVSITILPASSRNYGARRRGADHRAAESRTKVVGPQRGLVICARSAHEAPPSRAAAAAGIRQ